MHGKKTLKKKTAGKRLTVIMTAVIILVLLLGVSGCGGSGSGPAESGKAKTSAAADAGKIVAETDREVTVIDQAGREVTVPRGVESIAISYRVVARFIITLGEGDKIKGIGKTEEFLYTLEPGLKDAVDVGKGVPDLEAVAELAPDVYFHRASDIDGLENVAGLGIPAVGLSFEDPGEMKTALTIMGAVLDKEERAQELIAYYDKKIAADEKEAETVQDKKTAIVMGSSIGKVADGSMLQSRMIELAGGISPAAEIKASELWPTVGTEQIFKWDPDFIFITGSEGANYTPADIYSDPAWSEMKAVKEKHVCLMPATYDSWEFPGVVSVLGIDFMKNRMYPELLGKEQLQDNIDEFYKLSYGKIFGARELGYQAE
ncbi:MAG: ABC transporter substrate-binding protein [Lachnospiraceae bacterium]|nr:ABC transporter substrate-binding protein [Lachnospiraceae bacterium]